MKALLVSLISYSVLFVFALCGTGEKFSASEQTPNSFDSFDFSKVENKNAATEFLKSLNTEQRKKTLMPIDDKSRERWHYLPSTMFDRGGIPLKELNEKQKNLAFKLLEDHLSKTGYEKVRQIITLEEVLAELSGNSSMRDPEKYSVAIYGNPATEKLWAWSFEGHHISLNFTITDKKVSVVPRFLGANPATIQTGKRKGERTLAEEADLGMELINSLNHEQKQKTIIQDSTFYDIVTRNKSEVSPFDAFGIKMKELNETQKANLQKLIGVYLSVMPKELATKRLENLKKEDFSEIQFGWAGATEKGKPHYYRIQGKSFLIEFDNSQNSGNHIHTVWRDFNGDFGRDLIKEHYKNSNHHK